MKTYQIYIGNNDYCEEFDTFQSNGNPWEAEAEYERGYRANNAGQPDEIIEKLDRGDLWFSAQHMDTEETED